MPGLWSEQDGERWLDNPRRRRRHEGGAHRRRSHRRRHFAMNDPGPKRRRRHHRRHFARNPMNIGGLTHGIGGRLTEGLKGGAGVVLGKAVVRTVPGFLKMDKSSMLGLLVQPIVGIVAAPFIDRFLKGMGKPFLYGAFASPLESLVVKFNIPIIAPALSSYADELAALPGKGISTLSGPAAIQYAPGFSIDEEEQALVQ